MELHAMLQYGVFLLIVTALVYPVGAYLTRVFAAESTWLDPGLRPLERWLYRLAGIDAHHEMDWKEYASAFVVFSLAGTLLLYALLRIQPLLHTFDPVYHPAPLSPDLALNTAISFMTTTTWQAYGGETTMSYLSQMVGLVVQNFLAGAAGLAVGIAFIRGLARERTAGLGNFWVDLTRALLWVLLPLPPGGAAARLAGRTRQLPALSHGAVGASDELSTAQNRQQRQSGHRYQRQSHHRHGPGDAAGHSAGAGGSAGVHQKPGHQRRRLF